MSGMNWLSRPGLLSTAALLLLTGCGAMQSPLSHSEAGLLAPSLNPITATNAELRKLPPPEQSIAVAVYGYGDQTGKYKEGEGYQTLSRAVTQGGASILIKALQDAALGQWFTVIEREKLNYLLQERKIILDMRKTYLGEKTINKDALPPLLFAGILLDGGIIGFDSNTRTGGVGARYFGLGADVKYREDTVTVYLRGISTKTGEVLLSTVARKKILSYGIQGGLFRFVEFDRLLEAEAGLTRNEPDQLAVQQAIEKAVLAFIAEGAAKGLWQFSDKAYQGRLIQEYEMGDIARLNLPPELHPPLEAERAIAEQPAEESETETAQNLARNGPTEAPPPGLELTSFVASLRELLEDEPEQLPGLDAEAVSQDAQPAAGEAEGASAAKAADPDPTYAPIEAVRETEEIAAPLPPAPGPITTSAIPTDGSDNLDGTSFETATFDLVDYRGPEMPLGEHLRPLELPNKFPRRRELAAASAN